MVPTDPLLAKIYQLLTGDPIMQQLLNSTAQDPRVWWMTRPSPVQGYPLIAFQEVTSPPDTRFRGANIGNRILMFTFIIDQFKPELLKEIDVRMAALLNWQPMSVANEVVSYLFWKTDSLGDTFDDSSRTWSRRVRYTGVVQDYSDAVANS